MSKKYIALGVSVVATLTTAALIPRVYAEPSVIAPAPGGEAPGGTSNGQIIGGDSSSVQHSGVMSFVEDMATDSQTYESSNNAENAILMTSGTVTLTNPTINKTGSDDGDSADFYGTNAAVFVSGGTLNITGGTVTTNGSHANGVFAYGDGIINISNANIKTTSNNSGAVMVTGGGTLTATYVTATTDGNSSAPIRSDRGGGKMYIENGTYTSNGVGSPAIYSTADIEVKGATLESTASEGVVIEGKNSVELENVKLTANNNTLNGQSETYKTIFIYQSMSGDADEGVGAFTAKDSTITTKNGDTFFVTNTSAEINLENNIFENTSGDFLRIQTSKWGTSGSNGGNVILNATAQEINGGIIVDNISTLSMALYQDSFYKGVINGDNTAQMISVHLDADSVMVLEGDSYITSLDNNDAENKNIYGNGHKLYVNGVEVATNSADAPTGRKNKTASETVAEEIKEDTKEVDDYSTLGFIIGAAGSFLVLVIGGIIIARTTVKCRGKNPEEKEQPVKKRGIKAEEVQASSFNGGQKKGPNAR